MFDNFVGLACTVLKIPRKAQSCTYSEVSISHILLGYKVCPSLLRTDCYIQKRQNRQKRTGKKRFFNVAKDKSKNIFCFTFTLSTMMMRWK